VGWDESAYDDVDIMLIKSFIMNELEREYGERTHIELYSLGDLIEKMENLVGNRFHPKTCLLTKWLVSWTVSSVKR